MNLRNSMSPIPWAAGRRFGKRGIGMLEVMILIAVMSSLLIAGSMQWRVRSYENTSRLEQIKLTQADAALMAFTTVANRLPCPDTNRDGIEDCGGNVQKGWLPTTTLRLAGADAGVNAGQLRYLVQRGAPAIDLALSEDDWRPLGYDGNSVSSLPSNYAGAVIRTLSDMCSRLGAGAVFPAVPTFASVAVLPTRLVAYALAHPGTEDDDGDGDLFDGQNTLASPTQLEPSDRRSALGLYDDVVFERSMTSVRSALGCDVLNNSIDAVSLAADAVDAVKSMKDGNIADGIKAVVWAAASALLTSLSVIDTSMGIASDAANAGVDSAACAASLGLAVNACAAIPFHTAAAILGAVEVGLNISSAATSLIAVGIAGVALGLADADATTTPRACTPSDPSAQIAALNARIQENEADLVSLNNRRNAAITAKVNAEINKTNKITELRNAILDVPANPPNSTSPLDGFVVTLTTSGSAVFTQQAAIEAATAQRDNAQQAYNSAALEVTRYQNLVDNRAALTVATQNSLTVATQQLAIYNTPPVASTTTIATQEGVVGQLQLDLRFLTEPIEPGKTPTLVLQLAGATAYLAGTATSVLNAATTALNNATTARAATVATYSGAYSGLLNASLASYTVTQPGGATSTVVFSYPGVSAKLAELFGFFFNTGATAPHPDSVFAAPEKLQRQINSLDVQITESTKLLAASRDALAKLTASTTLPPECTFALNPARPLTPAQARLIIVDVDRKGGTR